MRDHHIDLITNTEDRMSEVMALGKSSRSCRDMLHALLLIM
jgi:hypothetical protein